MGLLHVCAVGKIVSLRVCGSFAQVVEGHKTDHVRYVLASESSSIRKDWDKPHLSLALHPICFKRTSDWSNIMVLPRRRSSLTILCAGISLWLEGCDLGSEIEARCGRSHDAVAWNLALGQLGAQSWRHQVSNVPQR